MRWFKKLFKPKKNPHCECETDCGAQVYYTTTGIGKQWCPTVMKRITAPFRRYPWNQVGVNGQVLSIDERARTWELKDKDDKVLDSGTMKGAKDEA